MTVVVVHTVCSTLRAVEHAVHDVLPALPNALVCTHEVRGPAPHYAVSVTLDGDVGPAALAALDTLGTAVVTAGPTRTDDAALRAAWARDGGRAVRFAGQSDVPDEIGAADLVSSTAIDRLIVVGGDDAVDDDAVTTRGFLRPLWREGELVLPVVRLSSGRLAPFEVPDPTPCCGGH